MTDIAITERWVAGRHSAREASGAFLVFAVRRRPFWVLLGAVEVLLAVLLWMSFDDRYGATRFFWAPLYALVPTLAFAVLTLGIGYLLNRRFFRQRLAEGVVVESGIGEDALALRGPWSEVVLSFDGIASVKSVGNWVFLQQIGVPLIGVWPAKLFPSADMARLVRSIETRRHVSA